MPQCASQRTLHATATGDRSLLARCRMLKSNSCRTISRVSFFQYFHQQSSPKEPIVLSCGGVSIHDARPAGGTEPRQHMQPPGGASPSANEAGDFPRRQAANQFQPENLAHLAHRRPLCWHPVGPSQQPRERARVGQQRPGTPGEISQNGGRDNFGMVGDITRD